jgi:glycosyltransferase involved in cell wall biosynthesis
MVEATRTRVHLDSTDRERPIRVVMVVTGFPNSAQPFRGVFNLRAAQSLRAVSAADVEVVFLRAWVPGRAIVKAEEYERVPVTTVAAPQLPGGHPINISMYRQFGWPLLRSLLRRCDLVHSVDAVAAGVVASAWGRRAAIRHVTQVIGSDVNSILPRVYLHPAIRGWNRHVHGVACNSLALVHAYQGLYPNARNVRAIYRGVDLEHFRTDGPVQGPLAEQRPVRFLFLGGFPPYPTLPHRANTKGGETLLAAWQAGESQLAAAGASLLLAGPGADSESVAQWRARLRHPERVHMTGAILPAMVPSYLRAADVVLLPSMEEGLPNVAMEAAACGRAVFGSAVGGTPEVVVHEETGLILPPGAVGAWEEALCAFAHRLETVQLMGQRARKRMESCFDRREFPVNMVALYQAAMDERLDGAA